MEAATFCLLLDPVRGGSDAGIGERSALEGAKEEAWGCERFAREVPSTERRRNGARPFSRPQRSKTGKLIHGACENVGARRRTRRAHRRIGHLQNSRAERRARRES